MVTASRVLVTIGGLLQIVGVCMVLVEISQVQVLLKRRKWTRSAFEGLLRPLRALANKIRPRKGQTVFIEGAALAIGGMRADIRVTVHDPPGGTVRERLDAHGRQLAQHERQLEEARAQLEKHRSDVADRIQALEAGLREETRQLQKLVHELGAGSLRLRGIGVFFLLFGTALTIVGAWL
jgi:hypothetical protein